jgi:outer membrane protein W
MEFLMRRHIAVVMVLLSLIAASAVAQDKTAEAPKGTFRVFAFGSNFGYSESDVAGSKFHGGYGLGVEYRLSERWSAEVSVSREEAATWTVANVGPDGQIRYQNFSLTTHPVDAVAQYHFFTRSAWKPFVGVGARYVGTEQYPGSVFLGDESRLSAELNGGFYYNFTRNLGLRVDVRRLLRNDSAFYDDTRKVSIGLGWSF